jgi:hypothetical protein
VAVVHRALVERVEVAAAPEVALELVGLGARVADGEGLAEDPVPGHQRDQGQQAHHQLHHQAGVEHEFDDGQVLGHVHGEAFVKAASCAWMAGGIRFARPLAGSMQATRIFASSSRSSPRTMRWANSTWARRGHAPARRALQIALLDQVGFEHVLDGVALFADGGGEVVHADRPPPNFSSTAAAACGP